MPMLGKPFFTQKKQPAKINILSGKIEPQITYALRSTRILVGGGKCTCVQVGTTHQSVDEIAENIVIGSKGILSFLNGWKNVKSIHLRTKNSISIPLYPSDTAESDS